MSLRASAPRAVKVHGRSAAVGWGLATAPARMLPSFVIAGAQRAGTTSLYRALMTHPLVLPAVLHKGVNYFDVNYDRGPRWYRAHFPVAAAARRRVGSGNGSPVTFDASGYYMFHPLAAQRMAADLPGLKVLAMLRDPVERAYSAHRHELARGFETECFERAIELEDERLDGEEDRMRANPAYVSWSHRHHAYVRRGQYGEQLARLGSCFPEHQVHVVESERFFAEPEQEYVRVLEFLGLPVVLPASFERYNSRPRSPMPESVRARLRAHFEPHDARLRELLGREPAWRR
jgi:hypothetical protein